MSKFFSSLFSRQSLPILSLGALCVLGSFSIGIHTAGDVQPIAPLEAEGIVEIGDVDGSGDVTVQDVIVILEIAQGYETALPSQLQADPNRDGRLTVDDALSLLYDLKISQ
jgi:hypothetical protein